MGDIKKEGEYNLIVNYALIFIFLIGLFWAFTGFFSYGTLIWAKEPGEKFNGEPLRCTYIYRFRTIERVYRDGIRSDCPIFVKFG